MQTQGENCQTCRPDGLKLSTVNGVTRVEVPQDFGFDDQGGISPMVERAMAVADQLPVNRSELPTGLRNLAPPTSAKVVRERCVLRSESNGSLLGQGSSQFATGQSAAAEVLGLWVPPAANNLTLLGSDGHLTAQRSGLQTGGADAGSGITFGPDSLKPPDHLGGGLDVEDILRMNEEERKKRVAEEAARIAAEEYAARERAWRERHRVALQEVEQRKASCELKCANDKRERDDQAQKDYEDGYAALLAATAGAAGAGAGVGTVIPGVGTVAGALGGAAFVAISGVVALMNAHARALADSLIKHKTCMNACRTAYDNEMAVLRRDL